MRILRSGRGFAHCKQSQVWSVLRLFRGLYGFIYNDQSPGQSACQRNQVKIDATVRRARLAYRVSSGETR